MQTDNRSLQLSKTSQKLLDSVSGCLLNTALSTKLSQLEKKKKQEKHKRKQHRIFFPAVLKYCSSLDSSHTTASNTYFNFIVPYGVTELFLRTPCQQFPLLKQVGRSLDAFPYLSFGSELPVQTATRQLDKKVPSSLRYR